MRQKLWDPEGSRLVVIGEPSSAELWDRRWDEVRGCPEKLYGQIPRRSYVVRWTRALLPPGSLVLEAGCGLARHSWHLRQLGFRTVGLDYAPRTLWGAACDGLPVPLVLGDVRALPLNSGAFDGIWSIGVIEHFFQGYGHLVEEMTRVLRPGGILFLVFPHLSRWRRFRARRGRYQGWRPSAPTKEAFYQFELDEVHVREQVTRRGFTLIQQLRIQGWIGLVHDHPQARKVLEAVAGTPGVGRALRFALDRALRPLTSHCILQVYRRGETMTRASRADGWERAEPSAG